MRDFPSCFGENGVQVADSSSSSSPSSKTAQNVVTCVYQCRLRGRPCLITVTWTKNLIGQGLTVAIDDASNQCLCKVDIKPWLFSKRKGSKSLEAYSSKIDVHWDLSPAKFGSGSPEPTEGYFVAVAVDRRILLLLGDLRREAIRKANADCSEFNASEAVLVMKKENVFGKRVFSTKARFSGSSFSSSNLHDLSIECDTASEPSLVIRIDGKSLMQVKRLRWKFRGNHTILVDGVAVEVFWDVHSWLFGSSGENSGAAVFMFKTCLSAEKLWSSSASETSSVPWSFSQRFSDSKGGLGLSFSLILYAWKSE